MINWDKINDDDILLIKEIVNRAYLFNKTIVNKRDLEMTLTAAHIANPLKLKDLLVSDDFNFIHDICGINRHIDIETGELKNCFLPRFTA